MKIVLVGAGMIEIPPKGYGAVEKHVWELSKALQRIGVDTTILNKVFGKRSVDEYRFALWAKKQLKKMDYDILHLHTTGVGFVFSILKKEFVYTSHSRHWISANTFTEKIGALFEKRIMRKAKYVIALSPEIATLMRKYNEAVVIPNGVDTERYKPCYKRRTGKNVVCLGAVVPHKKFDLVAKAVKDLNCKLTIVGPIKDKKYSETIKKISNNVEFTGTVPENRMIKILSEADVFVHPSISEAFPMAVIEGMSCGLPIIASDICKGQVTEGLNGFSIQTNISDKERVKVIKEKIGLLLEDDMLRKKFSEKSEEIVLEKYSWDKIAEKVKEVYKNFQSEHHNL
ncbi:MAG: glycosyltransferase family 4 protein [Candidatus Thermoplasmatota archaeon]|nr:glycosyltransferase family 4 protein [Candidatus Thermoplasmatota archaeon]MCG2827554.1 glycosyltransferase family 4 protein [Thermoplasmatales archaeon]